MKSWFFGFPPLGEREGGCWIGGDAYTAPLVAVKQSGSYTYYYLLRDYLGNITHQVNTSNTVVAEYSYDAWRRRRDKDTWSYTLSGEPALFADRTFTSHEYLPWFNLVNMNGRLYDPMVGRFLSTDNYIQDPLNSQNFNRYSYCLNNPLKYIDPLGEKWKWPKFSWGYLIPVVGWLDYIMETVNLNTQKLSQKMEEAGVPNFGVSYNTTFGTGFSIGNNPTYYPGYEKRIAEGQQRTSNQLDDVIQTYGPAWRDASNGENGNWQTLAFGMTDDFTFAFGPGGLSYEIGSFQYKGDNYTISTLGYAIGWDISAGVNALFIRGSSETFNPYDLKGWSTQRNGSVWYGSVAYEIPFERAYKPYNLNSYRTIAPGATIGTNFLGGSMVWGYTWIYKTPKAPTLTDLYRSRPGGY